MVMMLSAQGAGIEPCRARRRSGRTAAASGGISGPMEFAFGVSNLERACACVRSTASSCSASRRRSTSARANGATPTSATRTGCTSRSSSLVSTTEGGTSLILITHDLGVVAGMTQRINVMYAGFIVETATTVDLFANPSHPYTVGLLHSIPRLDDGAVDR